MKKLLFCFLTLYVSVFVFAQDANVTEPPQKPSKEDFYYTWVTERIEGKNKYSIEIIFLNESSYTYDPNYFGGIKQNFTILKWEEAVNTYTNTEEYPYGFKISAKSTKKTGGVSNFAVFINADKTKYLLVMDLGFYTQYDIYTKKETN